MKTTLTLLLCLLVSSGAAADKHHLALTVTVKDAEPNVGQVFVSLYDSEKTYMKEPVDQRRADVDENGESTVAFDGLEPGEYAVTAFYDEDSDGKLKTGLFRIPKEKIGYSNNAKGKFGPASYKKTKFVLAPDYRSITINLVKVM